MSLTAGKQLLLSSLAGYRVSRSLRFSSGDSSYLSRTPASAGNRKTWTWSGWVKRTTNTDGNLFSAYKGSGTVDSEYFGLEFTSDSLRLTGYSTNYRVTTQVFRDYSAWYHIVVATDTTNATASDRFKIYVNGAQVTTFSTTNNPALNADLGINQASEHTIGRQTSFSAYFNGYLANIEFVDGSALTPSSFAETDATTGQWVPKLFSGSYGTNGFKLTFADNSNNTAATLGADTSSNGNNWTPNNLSVTAGVGNDALTDSPTSYGSGTSGGDVRGNFCTLNPLDNDGMSLSNGSLDLINTASTDKSCRATVAVSSGKWYWEILATDIVASDPSKNSVIGIAAVNTALPIYPGNTATSWGYVNHNGVKLNNNSGSSYGNTWATNDIISVAFDADNGKLYFAKNGTWQASGDPSAGTNAAFTGITGSSYAPCFNAVRSGALAINFGQRAFAYTPPANFKPLVDTYLPTPTVAKPSEVMDVKLYTGNGSTQTISGLGFSPDFVWVKKRNTNGNNFLADTVRGTTKALLSDATDAEYTNANYITAFNSDGFSVGSDSGYNTSSHTYVAWTFDAGSSTVTNGSGSITSSCRTNQSSGFSIITFNTQASGTATVGHGLGVAPEMFIIKARTVVNQWWVYHKSLPTPQSNAIALNLTNAALGSTTLWNNTAPTSSVLHFDSGWAGNNPVVVYAWAPVAGYSSFGSYTSNNSADGPFIYTGFKIRFLLVKQSGGSGNPWLIFDSARSTYNVVGNKLAPNSSVAEDDASIGNSTQNTVDFLSNGFKFRTANTGTNGPADTYIYCAWAESPFQYARAR